MDSTVARVSMWLGSLNLLEPFVLKKIFDSGNFLNPSPSMPIQGMLILPRGQCKVAKKCTTLEEINEKTFLLECVVYK